ncbi:hypothetical protein [Acetivibrio clariflavus]|uniref:Peptidase C39-like domain-containing protein n=1 Tax=Acetivibrio clariflavus (strain DSM 19732 / NBRC 101661 / EBR45) TaxID=720554 RepID=G8LSX2_ACECE|nr:hypothetical protein [Acetivibrio clariflavus]AEV70485.1 hypothetical protein Clocl_4049 [Acetivibrio clariflavus DSM 19732]
MDLKEFVLIAGSGGVIYYGGDQSWFDTKVGRQSGCGTVAAANTTAYLALKNPELKALYSGNNLDNITKDDFIVHMNQVYKYVEPLKMPFFVQPAGGIPFLSWYADGVIRYAKSKGISLRAHWNKREPTFNNAVQYIKDGLRKDCPVALVNWRNSKLKSIPWTNPDTGITSNQDFQIHWVTITGLHDYRPIGQVYIDVSSWGSKATLNFNDVWSNNDILGYAGMIYFDW